MILTVQNLYKSFGGLSAVSNCSFEIRENIITGLIGPNGAGKTTIFNLITGFLKPDRGEISYRGTNLIGLHPFKIVRLGVSRTFQDLRIFKKLTVRENVLLGNQMMVGEGPFDIFFRYRRIKVKMKEYRGKVDEVLAFVDVIDKADEIAENLSYAEWKLVSLARVLASDPDLILLDEPASGLDPKSLDGILPLLQKLAEQKKTVLIIEHNLDVIRAIAQDVCFLSPGGIMRKRGNCHEILEDQEIISEYLGVSR